MSSVGETINDGTAHSLQAFTGEFGTQLTDSYVFTSPVTTVDVTKSIDIAPRELAGGCGFGRGGERHRDDHVGGQRVCAGVGEWGAGAGDGGGAGVGGGGVAGAEA